MRTAIGLAFALIVGSSACYASANEAAVLWSWDQATGATAFGAFDPRLRLFLECGEGRAVGVPRNAPIRPQPGKTCDDGSVPRVYGSFASADALFAAARRDAGLTAGKRAFFRFLLSPAGAAYLNAARRDDAAQMFITLQNSGLKGTTVPGTTAGAP